MKDKLYISFLKDLGLYHAYQISRAKDYKSRISRVKDYKSFDPSVAERSYDFAEFVDRSFTWATSGYCHIWVNLKCLTEDMSDANLREYIIDGIETDEIKKIKQEISIVIEKCQS